MEAIDEKPGIEEQYSSACGSSNLRVGNDSTIRTPGDMIAAAGMNKHRMGLALRRLRTEWDKCAIPARMDAQRIQALADSLEREGSTMRVAVPMTPEQIASVTASAALGQARSDAVQCQAFVTVPNQHTGLVRTEVAGKVQYRKPVMVAREMAGDWYMGELRMVMGQLKRLPEVRAGLAHFHGDEYVVAKVLEWWLSGPTCPACGGREARLIPGTNHLSAKPCKPCRGTGLKDPPHGIEGERVYGYMKHCLTESARELREGAKAARRSPEGIESRADADIREKSAALARNPPITDDPVKRARIASFFDMGKRKLPR